jgi:hypothetical protein
MTEYFVKRTSKRLFPSLARDERKRLICNVLLVMFACLVSAGGLSAWMLLAGASGGHCFVSPNLSLWPR